MADPHIRLILLCHAATRSTRRAAFADGEAAEEKGLAAAAGLAGSLPSIAQAFVSPALCARQTAAALGVAAVEKDALRDCDWGRWRGLALDEAAAAEPDAVATWLTDPDAAPHGGESVTALVRRVAYWMDGGGLAGTVLAVTHQAVVRAAAIHALGAPASCFWRLDAPPLSALELTRSSGRWRMRASRVQRASSPPI